MMNRSLLLFSIAVATIVVHGNNASSTACRLLNQRFPGLVHFPASTEFVADISHFDLSSTQNAMCSVEPSSVDHVSTILKIVGQDDIRAPFAVKGGGHSTNIGFSSTLGVQIAMSKFDNVTYDATSQTVKIGSGLTWDQVYSRLQPFNVTVVGGRLAGIGIGLALGGGYGWVTDQYGLAIDNVVAHDLVLPNGTFVEVTEASHPDLFFGLKGGLNNFGIVTAVTVKAHPLGQIWGGAATYSNEQQDAMIAAISNFSVHNTDLKAQVIAGYIIQNGQILWAVEMFYSEPTQPAVFQPFLDIPTTSLTTGVMSLTDFLGLGAFDASTINTLQNVIPIIRYTAPVLESIVTQVNLTYEKAVKEGRSVNAVFVNCELFHNPFSHSTPSAYAHSASSPMTPANSWIEYTDIADFDFVNDALRNITTSVQAVAIREGQSTADALHYPNYALADTPLELMYGDNVETLRKIRESVDPKNVMGLTGGFRF